MSEALQIECADGQVMPYLGYICTSITPYGMPIDSFHGCSFLVVPTSQSEYLFVLKKTSFQDLLMLQVKSLVPDFYKTPTFIPHGIWNLNALH